MGCRIPGMTTQEYRASYNYREEYFKRNPGIFGCIWFCSQCYKPLLGKKNVVIDHILPLNKGGRNHVSNCTACCRECNSAKSDIVDGRVIKGYAFKAVESTASRANKGVGALASLGLGLTAGTASMVTRAGINTTKATAKAGYRATKVTAKFGAGTVFALVGLALRLSFKVVGLTLTVGTFPLRKGSITSRLVFLVIYALLGTHWLSSNTALLNAWLV